MDHRQSGPKTYSKVVGVLLLILTTVISSYPAVAKEHSPRRILYYYAQNQYWAMPIHPGGVLRFNQAQASLVLKVVHISAQSVEFQAYTVSNSLTLIEDVFHQANPLGRLRVFAADCRVLARWGVLALSVDFANTTKDNSEGQKSCISTIKKH